MRQAGIPTELGTKPPYRRGSKSQIIAYAPRVTFYVVRKKYLGILTGETTRGASAMERGVSTHIIDHPDCIVAVTVDTATFQVIKTRSDTSEIKLSRDVVTKEEEEVKEGGMPDKKLPLTLGVVCHPRMLSREPLLS